MKKKYILIGALMCVNAALFAQVGIGTTTPQTNAVLDLSATNKGLLVPRLTTVERAALKTTLLAAASALDKGMQVFDTNTNSLWYWNGTDWVENSGDNIYDVNGTLAGNRVVTQGANTLAFTSTATHGFSVDGTTLSVDAANNRVGLGTAIPAYTLDINGTLGYGSLSSRTETRNNADIIGAGGAQSGFFETQTPVNYPAGASSWWHLIDCRHSNPNNGFALQIAGSFYDQELWFRKTNSTAAQPWTKILTASNGWSTTGNSGTNPAVNFIGTTDATDFVARTNNVERLRVKSDGNVGIGTATPNGELQFSNTFKNRKIVVWAGSNDDNQFYGFGTSNNIFRYQVSAPIANHVFFAGTSSTTSNELMRIEGTGNVGIGTSAPTAKLDINGNLKVNQGIWSEGNLTNSFINNAPVQRAIFGQSDGIMDVMCLRMTNNTINNVFARFENSLTINVGSISRTAGGVAYNTISDIRLKENIVETHYGLTDLMQIQVADYSYKTEKNSFQTGFLAQQLHSVYPDAVFVGGEDVTKNPWMIDYGKVTPLLVKSIQDQQAIIDKQQEQINELILKVNQLTNK